MPCISPETTIEHFAFIGGVGFKDSKLKIASGFKYKTNHPQKDTGKVKKTNTFFMTEILRTKKRGWRKKNAVVITKPRPQKRSTILTFLTITLMIHRIVISIRITTRA